MSRRIGLVAASIACSWILGLSASAATNAEGTLTALVSGPVVDLGTTVGDDSGRILGVTPGVVDASQTTGAFSGLTAVTVNGFDYTPSAFPSGTPILVSGPLLVQGLQISSVVEGASSVELLGTGTLVDVTGTYADTAVDWKLAPLNGAAGIGVFTLTTAGTGSRGGAAPMPEPSSALAFAVGLLVVGRALRKGY